MEITTKEKILIAASRLFRKQGYHATTLNQITKESNTPRGSVYYYFENGKEQLAQEAILRTGKIIKAHIEDAFNKETDAAIAVQQNINNMADEIEQQRGKTDIFSLVAISREVSATNPLLQKTCEEVYNSWIAVYAQKLRESGFHSEEAYQLAIAIQAWVEGAYALSVSSQAAMPMYIVGEQVLKLLGRNNY